ncbi:hypothetical protein ACFYQA_35930 [Streptomyces sp. NPDC005774]|uniref:hypothetical protein n=1 Tax=Streptomyces sp. NPDC005774 TaxID=3364728 RepID=UPI00369B0263
MRARAVRRGARGAVLGLGILWWWAVARLLLVSDAGVLEAAVAAGGWGLSLLPVHCMPKGRAEGALADGRWRWAWEAGAGTPEPVTSQEAVTTASPRPRAGGESGPW